MLLILDTYLGFALVAALPVVGPLLIGRWLADRGESPDPEVREIEAHALLLLAGSADD